MVVAKYACFCVTLDSNIIFYITFRVPYDKFSHKLGPFLVHISFFAFLCFSLVMCPRLWTKAFLRTTFLEADWFKTR